MLLLKLTIAYAIPDVPAWVAKEMAKIEYKRREIEKGNMIQLGSSFEQQRALQSAAGEDKGTQAPAGSVAGSVTVDPPTPAPSEASVERYWPMRK